MLQCQAGIGNLALVGAAAQLLHQLCALGKAGGAQRVALDSRPPEDWSQTCRHRCCRRHRQTFRAAHRAQAQGLVGQQFVLRKAVMQLHHVHVLGLMPACS